MMVGASSLSDVAANAGLLRTARSGEGKPADVSFEAALPWAEGHLLTITDDLDLIVATIDRIRKDVELVEGRYAVRRWDGGEELGSVVAVVAAEESIALQVP